MIMCTLSIINTKYKYFVHISRLRREPKTFGTVVECFIPCKFTQKIQYNHTYDGDSSSFMKCSAFIKTEINFDNIGDSQEGLKTVVTRCYCNLRHSFRYAHSYCRCAIFSPSIQVQNCVHMERLRVFCNRFSTNAYAILPHITNLLPVV